MSQMRLFTVNADLVTGEWISGTLREVGTVDRAAHTAREDSDAEHYDTIEVDGETCAVIIRWVSE